MRGVFRSVDELKAAINRFLAETNADPKPFVWTADPAFLAAVKRGKQALESVHEQSAHRKLFTWHNGKSASMPSPMTAHL